MRPIRIALVGAGWVTEHHLAAYREMGNAVAVEAIADPDTEVLAERANRWGVPQKFASEAEMLASVDIDAVDVANPRQHHTNSIRLAARKGLAVICQKPLAPTLQEARDLVDELAPDVRLMVHENWRYRPHYLKMRNWIEEGRIGSVRQVLMLARTSGMIQNSDGQFPALQRQPMLADLDRMLLMEVMIHHVDALRSVLGDMTLLGAVSGSDSAVVRGEDRASLLFSANGAAVSVIGDFRTHGAPGGLQDELHIQGTLGGITLFKDQLRLLSGNRIVKEEQVDLVADYSASYYGMIAHFLDAVLKGDPATFRKQVEDNLKTLELIEQAYAFSEPQPPRPQEE